MKAVLAICRYSYRLLMCFGEDFPDSCLPDGAVSSRRLLGKGQRTGVSCAFCDGKVRKRSGLNGRQSGLSLIRVRKLLMRTRTVSGGTGNYPTELEERQTKNRLSQELNRIVFHMDRIVSKLLWTVSSTEWNLSNTIRSVSNRTGISTQQNRIVFTLLRNLSQQKDN